MGEMKHCILLTARLYAAESRVLVDSIVRANSGMRTSMQCAKGSCTWKRYRVRPAKWYTTAICTRCFKVHVCMGWATCREYQIENDCMATVCTITGTEICKGYSVGFDDHCRSTSFGGSYATNKRCHDDVDDYDERDSRQYDYDDFVDPDEKKHRPLTKKLGRPPSPISGNSGYDKWIRSVTKDGSKKELPAAPTHTVNDIPVEQKRFNSKVNDATKKFIPLLSLGDIASHEERTEELSKSISTFLWSLKEILGLTIKGNVECEVVAVMYLLSQGFSNELTGVRIMPRVQELGCILSMKHIALTQSKKKSATASPFPIACSKIKAKRKEIVQLVTSKSTTPAFNNTSILFPKMKHFTSIS